MVWSHRSFIYPFSSDVFNRPGYAQIDVPVPGADPLPIFVSDARDGAPVVLYFMGNAGALELFSGMLEHHRAQGRQVVAMTYRGGGGVPGTSSEAVLKRDALAVFDALETFGATGPVILHGYSLGTGLATHVAAQRDAAALMLSAPYAKMCSLMAKAAYLPACILPVDRWNTQSYAGQITEPVLHLHGTADALIPVGQGQKLAATLESGGATVQQVLIDGAGHTDLIQYPAYLSAIDDFIAKSTNDL